MLKFNPEHQITLSPTPNNKLSATLSISNPTARAAPFKVKSTRPSLFVVEPPVGILLPHQTTRVVITTCLPSSPELIHEVSYHNKFVIEFALVEKVPDSVNDGLLLINKQNRQEHKLFLGSVGKNDLDVQQARSGISNQYTYRTFNSEPDPRVGTPQVGITGGSYDGMNSDQKFEYLTREIDRLQKEKSEIIMTSTPKKMPNLFRIILVLILGLILGNILGKSLGLGQRRVIKKRQEGWVDKLGLRRFWPHQDEEHPSQWWKFWK